jgi:hypothetical protein
MCHFVPCHTNNCNNIKQKTQVSLMININIYVVLKLELLGNREVLFPIHYSRFQ